MDCILINDEYIALSNIASIGLSAREGKYDMFLHETTIDGVNRRVLITKRQFEVIKPLLRIVVNVDQIIHGESIMKLDDQA